MIDFLLTCGHYSRLMHFRFNPLILSVEITTFTSIHIQNKRLEKGFVVLLVCLLSQKINAHKDNYKIMNIS